MCPANHNNDYYQHDNDNDHYYHNGTADHDKYAYVVVDLDALTEAQTTDRQRGGRTAHSRAASSRGARPTSSSAIPVGMPGCPELAR